MWKCTVTKECLEQFLDSCTSVAQDGWIIVSKDSITCRILNLSNTVYGKFSMPAELEGDIDDEPIPMGLSKIKQVLSKCDYVTLTHDDNTLLLSINKQRIKFYDYTKVALRPIPPKLDNPMDVLVDNVKCTDIYNAINTIVQYNDGNPIMTKVRFTFTGGSMIISDFNDNVTTTLDCKVLMDMPVKVTVHAQYLSPVITHMKKYHDECRIHAKGSDKPLMFSLEPIFKYVFAPVIDGE